MLQDYWNSGEWKKPARPYKFAMSRPMVFTLPIGRSWNWPDFCTFAALMRWMFVKNVVLPCVAGLIDFRRAKQSQYVLILLQCLAPGCSPVLVPNHRIAHLTVTIVVPFLQKMVRVYAKSTFRRTPHGRQKPYTSLCFASPAVSQNRTFRNNS